jgi:5'-phosphate synthase pdxT subunit
MSDLLNAAGKAMRTGILALQGDFDRHAEKLSLHGATPLLIKKKSEIAAVDALVIPGGESTALLKLLDEDFQQALKEAISGGLPTFATCAGLILLARSVHNPAQTSFGLLDAEVTRNAYGSQRDSFISPDLNWQLETELAQQEGVFIRAPRITATGPAVHTILSLEDNPVCIQESNILAATFHPELGKGKSPLISYFLEKIASN